MAEFENTFSSRFDQLDRKLDLMIDQMNSGFKSVDIRFEQVDAQFKVMNSRLLKLEHNSKEVNIKLDAIALNLRKHGERILNLERRVDNLENEANS